jgi:hypothetical protein
MSAEPAYGRAARDRARLPIDPQWTTRIAIALAVFLGFLALGRVSVTTRGAGEATAPSAIVGSPPDTLTPARLAGDPPLEHLFARATTRARATAVVRRARRTPRRSQAPVPVSSTPAPTVRSEPSVQAVSVPVRAAPVAKTPSVSRAPVVRAPTHSHVSSGGSFDSSG